MRFAHIVAAHVAGKGGADSFILRFSQECEAAGHQNAIIADNTIAGASKINDLVDVTSGKPLTEVPDAIFLHTRPSWAFAQNMSRIAPTFAWVHDYAFVCPASIAWFRNTRQTCNLPLGLHCITNAYSKWCNARRPDQNLKNYLEVRHALDGVPYLKGVIVGSSFVKERMMIGGVPDSLLHVLPYFSPRDATEDPFESGIQENPRQLLFMGRLNETKGVDVLLESFSLLPSPCELVIAGEGYGKAAIEEQITRLDLNGKSVKFKGFFGFGEEGARLAAQTYLSTAVVVVPSLWAEPFCLVGLEAFSFGKPVVAFDVGGIREWMVDGEVGFLANPADPQDMADKILRLLDDAPLRHSMGHRGLELVRQKFTWARHWEQFTQILERSGVEV